MSPEVRCCLRMWLAAALCIATGACTSLADRIVTPPRDPMLDADFAGNLEKSFGIQRSTHITGAGPKLVYRTVPAAKYGFSYRYESGQDGAKIGFTADLSQYEDHRPQPIPARGTVVMLHGWGLDGTSMLPWALALAERGYRSILVDLRSHGASEQATIGFGPAEGADIAGLVRALERDGSLQGTTTLFGMSYGAVAGLHAAGRLQDEIDAVIAMSPYANAANGIRGMIDAASRMGGNSLSSRLQRSWIRMRYDEQAINEAIEQASQRTGTDLAALDTAPAVTAASACVLLLHGEDDGLFPAEDTRMLAEASPQATFVELPGEGHVSLPLRIDLLAGPIADWLDALRRPACPTLALPGSRMG